MPRPNQSNAKRKELIPIVARAFSKLGYRGATTAALAESCSVRENILYRLWPDKRAMFAASVEYVYQLSESTWEELLANADDTASPAELILDYEANHHGEFGLYRIVFAGLSETDDPEIAAAMKGLYTRFQRFILKHVKTHGELRELDLDPALVSWAIIGLGTVADVGRELGLLSVGARKRLLSEVGRKLLG